MVRLATAFLGLVLPAITAATSPVGPDGDAGTAPGCYAAGRWRTSLTGMPQRTWPGTSAHHAAQLRR